MFLSFFQYNSWFTFSDYQEPVTPRSCRPIHARELSTVSVALTLFFFGVVLLHTQNKSAFKHFNLSAFFSKFGFCDY